MNENFCGVGKDYIAQAALFPIVSSFLFTSTYPMGLIDDRSSITLSNFLANPSLQNKYTLFNLDRCNSHVHLSLFLSASFLELKRLNLHVFTGVSNISPS